MTVLSTPDRNHAQEGPIDARQRIVAIDTLRGVAVLGIFAVNVQSFAMPEVAYVYPRAFGDLRGANYIAWLATHVLASGKFITIFSLLFGAGLALRDGDGRTFARRQLALLAIGLAHAFLLWHGDVLVSYAIVGCLVWPFRNARPVGLIVAGAIAFVVGTIVMALFSASTLLLPAEAQEEVRRSIVDPNAIAAELAAFRGPFAGELAFRAQLFLESQKTLLPFYSLPLTGGLMLAGVGLARLGFFAGAWRPASYRTIAIVGLVVGLALVAIELFLDARSGHDPLLVAYVYTHLNTLSAVPLALAYAAIVIRFASRLPRAFAAVGRCALSCYLAQTLAGTTLFYGHGFGWFGRVDRVGQLGVVAFVWVACLVAAPLWLRAFRFGPVEWIWRSATYARWQPMRRGTV